MKQGFNGAPRDTPENEYGSALKLPNITPNKWGSAFSALLAKKQELNTLADSGSSRKPQVNPKDNAWLVTPRNKSSADAWFKDLATGAKTLQQLVRRVPIFGKKEEMLAALYEANVPMYKSAFYLKAIFSYNLAMSESNTKSKKRQEKNQDPGQEWTQALTKCLKEIYLKISDHYHSSSSSSSSSLTPGSTSTPLDSLMKQWYYFTQFTRHLFEENMLEKHDFLSWLFELFEKIKSPDDSILKLISPQLLSYSEDFTEFELLSRKLAYHSCKRLNQLLGDFVSNSDSKSQVTNSLSDGSKDSGSPPVPDVLFCPHHRSITLCLSSIVQIITLKCKTALVWHQLHDGKGPASLNGSPLDYLPCPPSALPMARGADDPKIREELKEAEEEIRLRSCAVENKWSSDHRWQQSSSGTATAKLLYTLDAVDRHFFDKLDSNNSMDTIYAKIFPAATRNSEDSESKFISETVARDESTVKLLCEWAVTTKRTGEYRSLVVAKLLERRENEITSENDDRDSLNNDDMTGPKDGSKFDGPIFQNLLMNFLDTQAPVLDDKNPKAENKMAFSNLVLLFGELIRCDVFSHDVYMSTLISRGLFVNSPIVPSVTTGVDAKTPHGSENSLTGFIPSLPGSNPYNSHGGSTPSHHSNSHHEPLHRQASESSLPMFEPVNSGTSDVTPGGLMWDQPQMSMADDDGIDADLDKILQNITTKHNSNNMQDQTDILLPEAASTSSEREDEGQSATGSGAENSRVAVMRHLQYTTHFPIPQDETTTHECNQRHILLYGVGKARDEARHTVKKITKDILKLFSRKASMDISEGGKVKKSATKDGFNFESTLSRFQSLPFFDQNSVTVSCATTCIEMLSGLGMGTANYLPLVESIAFLFDLMEMALNVHGMIEFIIQLLKELPDVDIQLQQKCPALAGSYTYSIGLYIVGVLFRYQSCLLVSLDDTFAVFEGCRRLVNWHTTAPSDCSSAERCIFGYLFDLYSSCAPIRTKYHDQSWQTFMGKVKQVVYAQLLPNAPMLLWNSGYMMEYITSPKTSVDPLILRQLNENPNCRYSFVCNAVKAIATGRDPNILNELSILCAELSARCPPLSSDWIGVLKAMCCSSNHACGFIDALTHREVADLSIHDNLAIFTSILVARRCFSLQDFVIHCALPSLLAACPQGGGDAEAEPGARLTCHLLLSLFRTSEPPLSSSAVTSTPATTLYSLTSPGPANLTPSSGRPSYIIKHPCDRYLLAAAHSCIRVEAVIAALKAILVLGMCHPRFYLLMSNFNVVTGDANEVTRDRSNSEVNISDLLGHIDDFDDVDLP